MALSAAQISSAFVLGLGREPSPAELAAFVAASQSRSNAQIYAAIATSAESRQIAAPVIRFYQAAFGRVPDRAGLANAEAFIRANAFSAATLQSLATQFTVSTEFTNRYGAGAAVDAAFVAALYQNVLGRAGSAAEIQAYTSGSNGYTTRTATLYAFAQSTEFQARALTAVDAFQVSVINGTATYAGALSIGIGGIGGTGTITLTSGTETVTGGDDDDSVVAGAGTLDGKTIDLAGGSNNEIIARVPTVSTPTRLRNVQSLTVTAEAPGGGVDLINSDGALRAITFADSGANSAIVRNVQSAVSSITIANTSANTALTVAASALTGASDSTTLNVSNVTGGAGITVAAVSGTNGYEIVNLVSGGSTLNNVGALRTDAATINLSGTAGIVLRNESPNFTTLNASRLSGPLYFDAGTAPTQTAQTITSGSGADFVRAGTGGDTIDTGGGRDTIIQAQGDSASYTATFSSNVFTGEADVITARSGDRIALVTGSASIYRADGPTANAGTIPGAGSIGDNSFQLVRGRIGSTTNGRTGFSAETNGPDSMLIYDANAGGGTALEIVLLRGFTGTVTASIGSRLPGDNTPIGNLQDATFLNLS